MNKPKPIKIIAILILVFSGLALMGTAFRLLSLFILSLIVPDSVSASFASALSQGGYTSTYFLITTSISSFLDMLFVIGAIGLLKYRGWGRKMVIYTAIGFLLESFGSIIYSGVSGTSLVSTLSSISGFIVGMIIYGLMIFYFNKKDVKKAFS